MKMIRALLVFFLSATFVYAEPLTLPLDQRPAWLQSEGIVMAGSWEPYMARLRQFNGSYEPTAEQVEGHKKEHSPEMLDELKALGVNFVMTHLYKGFGMRFELPDMEVAKDFAALCRKKGMRTGVYAFSGTIIPEIITKEIPDAAQWASLDPQGNPVPYPHLPYRHYVNRLHPKMIEHLKPIVKYAIKDIKVDLLHFDNFSVGPGFGSVTVERFRDYLKARGKPADFGLKSFVSAVPPNPPDPATPLGRAWIDFTCEAMALFYRTMGSYARSLKPDVLMELNAGLAPQLHPPIDHPRLLQYGEAAWNEVYQPGPGFHNGKLVTLIRSYKTAQAMDNMAFCYIRDPVESAETLAYNTDCFGCICWFQWGKIVEWPCSNKPMSLEILPYVRFFHEKRPYYRGARRVADVAALRSFASQVYAQTSATTAAFEQLCINSRTPWSAIYDCGLDNLQDIRALSLVGADALSDRQVDRLKAYVKNGGGIIITEETGRFDDQLRLRSTNPFADVLGPRVAKMKPDAGMEEFNNAVSRVCGREPSLKVEAPVYVCTELTEQTKPKRRLVHLVNYNAGSTVTNVRVDVRVPKRWIIGKVLLLRPDSPEVEPLAFKQNTDTVKFTVPRILQYGLISVEDG